MRDVNTFSSIFIWSILQIWIKMIRSSYSFLLLTHHEQIIHLIEIRFHGCTIYHVAHLLWIICLSSNLCYRDKTKMSGRKNGSLGTAYPFGHDGYSSSQAVLVQVSDTPVNIWLGVVGKAWVLAAATCIQRPLVGEQLVIARLVVVWSRMVCQFLIPCW